MIDQQQLESSLPAIAESGLPLLVHAELAGPIDAATADLRSANADWRKYPTYLASRPDEAELEAIRLMIRLCREYKFRLHIVHLATAQALDDLAAARAEGLPITVESCPHYLHFTAEEIPDGATLFKCAPPIRSGANCDQLWQGLRDGIIDMIVTDHSPCPPEMKHPTVQNPEDEGRFDLAWGGITSLSVALPVIWTECRNRGFSLDDLARWMSSAPAALAGISAQAGAILPGRDPNFTVFDPDASFTVTRDTLRYRHPISPYLGEELRGRIHATYLRGEIVFHAGVITGTPQGHELALS
jgi:allantoinase